jgi:two-component system cell cycle response regulator
MSENNFDGLHFTEAAGNGQTVDLTKLIIRVLLIEDDAVDSMWVQRQLNSYPHAEFHLTMASRLEQALEQMDSAFFDVVLLDLNLPDSHGGETILRTLMHAAKIPLIIFSGNRSAHLSESALQRGVYAYLIKDRGTAPHLAQTLHEAVLQRRAVQALESDKIFEDDSDFDSSD